jgi:hypothetical protein
VIATQRAPWRATAPRERARPGQSGNPGGRPKSLAKTTRALAGEDGMKLVELWWSIALRRGAAAPGVYSGGP